ncbi:DsbA family protein [Shewanella sp. YLB-07]|uniref:DsbA family protein n=1 Tax=Shewanella sp. YLB-07 TaxID=2601268 RepID=UPI003A0FD5A8
MQMNNSRKPTLYYVYDPMCSWCWGYAPTWNKLRAALKESGISVEYRLGGLAPDSDLPMPEEMKAFLEQTWHKIAVELGTEFNFDFWRQCQPRRSTYPACRTALIAREQGLEQAMLDGIQQAYYLKAMNPSDLTTLISIAASINLDIDPKEFALQLSSEAINHRLMTEIHQVQALPIQGFPSLVLEHNGSLSPIPLDYLDYQTSYRHLINSLNNDLNKME